MVRQKGHATARVATSRQAFLANGDDHHVFEPLGDMVGPVCGFKCHEQSDFEIHGSAENSQPDNEQCRHQKGIHKYLINNYCTDRGLGYGQSKDTRTLNCPLEI